ncbi:hypothetical protein MalM25_22290 [Planctomycetes bacterium MalM25]|nr:hypothetical protein MalM25_22290 [Planctomycetes bacterium MalM25]
MKPLQIYTQALLISAAQFAIAVEIYQADFSDTSVFMPGGADPYVELAVDGFSSADMSLTNSGTVTDARWSNDTTNKGFAEAVNSNATALVAAGGAYSSSIDFLFGLTANGNGPVIQSGLFDGAIASSDGLAMTLVRGDSDPNVYRLRLQTNWGNTYPTIDGAPSSFNQSIPFNESLLGLNYNSGGTQDLLSDQLRLTTTLTAGADTSSWDATGVLTNLSTNTQLATYTVNNVSFNAPAGSSLFGGFGTGQSGAHIGVTNREISGFTFNEESPLTPATWTDLKNELTLVKNQLASKMTEAQGVGISTGYARVSQVVLDRFTVYAQYDYDNPNQLEQAVDDLWWNAIVPDNYHLTLPFKEMRDSIEIGNRAIQDLQDQLDGVITRKAPVDFNQGGVTQGAKHWMQGGKPVFPSGFNWMPDDPDTIEAFGPQGGWYYPLSELRSDGTLPSWSINGDVSSIQSARAKNQVPLVSFFGSQLASWMKEQHPEVEDGRRNFIRWDIDHPQLRSWVQQFYSQSFPQVIPAAGDTPRVHLLANEPHLSMREGGWKVEYGVSEYTKDNYQAWLEDKYGGDIAALNATHGTSHADFGEARDAFPFLTDNPDPTKWGVPLSLQGSALWYDVMRFNMDRTNDWFSFNKQAVNANDPGAPVTIKLLGGSLRDNYRDGGIDIEYLANLQDVLGSDFTAMPGNFQERSGEVLEWKDRYTMEWRIQTMGLDFFKSIAPDKPFFDSEWHGFDSKGKSFDIPPEYVRAALWLGYTHGYSMTQAWVWGRENDGDFSDVNSEFVGEVLTQPKALDAYGRTMKELNAHAEDVARLVPAERKFWIYYVNDSAIQDTTYMADVEAVYESLKMLNLPLGFTTPTEIAGLTGDHTIIVPRTPFISDEKLAALEAFAGEVLLVDPSLSFGKDEHGFGRASTDLDPLASIDLGEVFTMADDFADALAPLVETPPLTISIADLDQQPAYGVLMNYAIDPDTGEMTFSLVNVSKDSRQVTINLPEGVESILDLITGQPAAAELVLAPYDVHLLQASIAGSLGDFNRDGVVDAADYTVWRDNLNGTDESAIAFAGVIDGVINQADLDVWRSNYGSDTSSASQSQLDSTAVPEPNAIAAAATALALLNLIRPAKGTRRR